MLMDISDLDGSNGNCPSCDAHTLFNYYLMYFSWWHNEVILVDQPNVNLQYILFGNNIVYTGTAPHDYYGFNATSSTILPTAVPPEIAIANESRICMSYFVLKRL